MKRYYRGRVRFEVKLVQNSDLVDFIIEPTCFLELVIEFESSICYRVEFKQSWFI